MYISNRDTRAQQLSGKAHETDHCGCSGLATILSDELGAMNAAPKGVLGVISLSGVRGSVCLSGKISIIECESYHDSNFPSHSPLYSYQFPPPQLPDSTCDFTLFLDHSDKNKLLCFLTVCRRERSPPCPVPTLLAGRLILSMSSRTLWSQDSPRYD